MSGKLFSRFMSSLTLANHKGHRESSEPIKSRNKKTQPVFTLYWTRKWREVFQPITKRSNVNPKQIQLKALANEDTLLRTYCCRHKCFPVCPRATFFADANFVSGTQKMFLILFRNILCPQQMFPSLRSPRNIMGNNVSVTMCPRLPGPLTTLSVKLLMTNKLISSLYNKPQRCFKHTSGY